VLLCCGKIYYELLAYRHAHDRQDVALVRIEQLYPFSYRALGTALRDYADGANYRWVQEEPANGGAWVYLRQKLARLLGRAPKLLARPASPAPAGGSHRLHGLEQQQIVEAAFTE